MNLLKDLNTIVKLSVRESIGRDEYDFIKRIDANFYTLHPGFDSDIDDIGDEDHLIATAECTFLDIKGLDDWDVFSFLDTDGGLFELYNPFFSKGRGNRLNSSITNKLFDHQNNNLFVIDKVLVSEPFRGRGISKEIIDHMIDKHATQASIAVLKAFPFEFKEHEDFDKMQKKLKRHYRSLDFKPVSGYDWMYRDISNKLKLTPDQDLLKSARNGHYRGVLRAIDNGADLNAQNRAGNTALDVSRIHNHSAIYEHIQKLHDAIDEQCELEEMIRNNPDPVKTFK